MPHAPSGSVTPQELRERSKRFALDVVKFRDGLAAGRRTRDIAEQLQRAATSIAANYRATCRARSHREFIAKICIAVEEADEAQHWLQILVESRKSESSEAIRLLDECTQLVKILSASKRTAMRNSEKDRRGR